MMVKWISCRVLDRAAFDRGQRAWGGLSGHAGFHGQCGGWSRDEPDLAHVFAWWSTERDHREFMAGVHDGLAAGQVGTYGAIDVSRWEHHLDIGSGLPRACPAGSVLRLAHCRVRDGRQDHFIRAQADVWNPGMRAWPGMLGGLFAGRGRAEYLVLSLWESAAEHDSYRTGGLPDLRRRAQAADDLARVEGDLILLDPAWTVS
ncbi:DUF4937 domain-containing protein [Pseudonocardiaceae bacterium YIM PH 21723]|nr:DUF4937 domain-containing protein [Pseudonocardiaceae bacterium YIM PH 21723]